MNPTALSVSSRAYVLTVGMFAVLAVAMATFALFAHADTGPMVTTKTTNTSNTVVTSAIVGTNVIEGAVVASSTASKVPTGSVTFSSFQNLACTGTPSAQFSGTLVNGMASSSQVAMTNAGLSYLAVYNGDASNTPSVSSCAVVASTSAPVVVPPPVATSTPGTISGTVFNDTNNNEKLDNGEGGLAGILVWLHLGKHKYNSPVVATTTTDSIGHYVFSNLVAGTYFVEQQVVNGFTQTSDDMKVKLNTKHTSKVVNFSNISASSTTDGQDNENNDKNDNEKNDNKGQGHFNLNISGVNTNIDASVGEGHSKHKGEGKDN